MLKYISNMLTLRREARAKKVNISWSSKDYLIDRIGQVVGLAAVALLIVANNMERKAREARGAICGIRDRIKYVSNMLYLYCQYYLIAKIGQVVVLAAVALLIVAISMVSKQLEERDQPIRDFLEQVAKPNIQNAIQASDSTTRLDYLRLVFADPKTRFAAAQLLFDNLCTHRKPCVLSVDRQSWEGSFIKLHDEFNFCFEDLMWDRRISGSEPLLVHYLLHENKSEKEQEAVAFKFLNSGNKVLVDGARAWAEAHGKTIVEVRGSKPQRWE